ncbi:Enamine deaminase RidA, house cleaning of reactive enamine intermediates, YjgF/YER057c/UK114 family [Devosia enhydra]|uniref:Enamine deaminase RidA, house cleaning of reactive enamine intermediates, YjgF/YER057c/UK114 family n=1 Tax=Devosia enhydra TaxID=665118 RepID=A0A1K2HVT4_9HYPH|nr:RidA family protein [Devosia enhydra]SFZ82582.1 Enamine deaminase RidA, house cleaning of reactive enamine intermediates, YjgF/YER057c/UK114 family [Devosia enhydra]
MVDGIELSSPPDVWPVPGYEHVARAGDFIFVAGQVARNSEGVMVGPGNAALQIEQVYKNIGAILRHVGATPQHVVKINTILVDRDDGAAVTAARKAFFGDHRPPHTGIIIAGLGSPEVRVEVEVVAYLPQKTS